MVNIKLYNNDELIINNMFKLTKKGNIISYDDNDTKNIINLSNKTFTRENDEFLFKLDINNKKIEYKLKESNLKFDTHDVDCNMIINENSIIIDYLFNDKFKIIINL